MRVVEACGCLLVAAGCGRIDFDPVLVRGAVTSCSGPEVVTTPIVTDGSATSPALVAIDRALALAYWMPGKQQVAAQRIGLDGQPSGEPLVATGRPTGGNGSPALAWTGSDLALIRLATADASNLGTVAVTRLDATMHRLASDVAITATATGTGGASIAWNGTMYGATWVAFDSTKLELGGWFAPLAPDATRSAEGVMAANFGDCFCTPAMAWTGTEWGIVFENDGLGTTPQYHVGLTRVDAAGNLIASPVMVSDDGVSSSQPRIAWTGTQYLVAWLDGSPAQAHVASVAPDGTRLADLATPASGPHGIALATLADDQVIVAFTDSEGLTLWALDTTLQPIGMPFRIVGAPDLRGVALAAVDGIVYAAWNTASDPGLTGDVSVARVGCPP